MSETIKKWWMSEARFCTSVFGTDGETFTKGEIVLTYLSALLFVLVCQFVGE